MPERTEAIARIVEPVVTALGLDLYDVELTGQGRGRALRVMIDRDGGVDLETITTVAEAVSPVLDAEAGLTGPYALEVSSPGLERPLRRPEHFGRAVGSLVSVKARDATGTARRLRGTLLATDDEGIDLQAEGEVHRLAFADVVQARTVFEWGPAPKPSKGARTKKKETARR